MDARIVVLCALLCGCEAVGLPAGPKPPHQSPEAVVSVCEAVGVARFRRFASLADTVGPKMPSVAASVAAAEALAGEAVEKVAAVEAIAGTASVDAAESVKKAAESAEKVSAVQMTTQALEIQVAQLANDSETVPEQISAIWNKLESLTDGLKAVQGDVEALKAKPPVQANVVPLHPTYSPVVPPQPKIQPASLTAGNLNRTILLTAPQNCPPCKQIEINVLPPLRSEIKVGADDVTATLEVVDADSPRGLEYRKLCNVDEKRPKFIRLRNGVVAEKHSGYMTLSEARAFIRKP
jgi:hypothetical protein